MKILFLSNGHGEDIIATRIAEQFQRLSPSLYLAALPIVGEGHAYQKIDIPIISQVQQMPSGGFIYQDRRELWRDIQGGLLSLTLSQLRAVRQWGQQGGKIVAVGDIVPLFFARISSSDYAFVGTAKSEYYIKDEKRWFHRTFSLENLLGSIYFPWERWLMCHSRCYAVFPRDQLTAHVLERKGVRSYDLGNPMMDGIEKIPSTDFLFLDNKITVLLLPGSRCPEAQRNWKHILQSVKAILSQFPDKSWFFLAAITPSLSLFSFEEALKSQQWQPDSLDNLKIPLNKTNTLLFKQNNAKLMLSQSNFASCLHLSQIGIAMAGTATEQFVGLGKPVITLPGEGPQFIYRFAEAQTRLLGESVILLENPEQVPETLNNLLNHPSKLQIIAENGQKRLGNSGGSQRIAACLIDLWGQN